MSNNWPTSWQKTQAKIDAIIERADTHAESLADTLIRETMEEFAKRLSTRKRLEFMCGNGSYDFRIYTAGSPRIVVVASKDVYYDEPSGYHTCNVRYNKRVALLLDLLEWLDEINNDHRIWFRDHKVSGKKA